MIIKKLVIENFLCYYGRKEFEFTKGLNIVLGENGEGKTKFFEALEWLFSRENNNLELLVSAKALFNAAINETFSVLVLIELEQEGVKNIIRKSFLIKKVSDSEVYTSNCRTEGIIENK